MPRIVVGLGVPDKLPGLLPGGDDVVLVSDRGVEQASIVARVHAPLSATTACDTCPVSSGEPLVDEAARRLWSVYPSHVSTLFF